MKIRFSGRSSDYISPSFGYGCLYNCTYCYMKRHVNNGLTISKNINQILTEINNHSYFTNVEKPNQTHDIFTTYDISCNEDFALHHKYYDWKKIFNFFKEHPIAMATLATKTIPFNFLDFNPNKKVRIRFSLMPQKISSIIEPKTAKIIDRIKAVDEFIKAGYDVHLNFSPVIVYNEWIKDYSKLFELCNTYIKNKETVFSEVIFLTHNVNKHYENIKNNLPGENLIWRPELQENKKSIYGGNNLRYNIKYKKRYIDLFKEIHNKKIPWNKIRYIF